MQAELEVPDRTARLDSGGSGGAGSYYVSRCLDNAFRSVIYRDTNPRDTLDKQNKLINEELARKHEELTNRNSQPAASGRCSPPRPVKWDGGQSDGRCVAYAERNIRADDDQTRAETRKIDGFSQAAEKQRRQLSDDVSVRPLFP